MSKEKHYRDYDVLEQKDAWDDHTQSIVTKRLQPQAAYQCLTVAEAETLRAITIHLVHDHRSDIIQFVISHFDRKLHASIGEGDRKAGLPEEKALIREGLHTLDRITLARHHTMFIQLDKALQLQMLEELQQQAEPGSMWGSFPTSAFFKKVLTLTLESYYSHPHIWSEIGYGGPAYPRGYVRTQLGQLDPWEAQNEHGKS